MLNVSNAGAFATFTETRTAFATARAARPNARAPIKLIKQPNPYMFDGPISRLSTDLRILQMPRAAQSLLAHRLLPPTPHRAHYHRLLTPRTTEHGRPSRRGVGACVGITCG